MANRLFTVQDFDVDGNPLPPGAKEYMQILVERLAASPEYEASLTRHVAELLAFGASAGPSDSEVDAIAREVLATPSK